MTPRVGGDMHAVLNGVPVAVPGAEVPEAGVSEDPRPVDRDQHRVALSSTRPEPDGALVERGRLVAEDGRRGGQHLVVDGEDLGDVSLIGIANVHGRSVPEQGAASPAQLATPGCGSRRRWR